MKQTELTRVSKEIDTYTILLRNEPKNEKILNKLKELSEELLDISTQLVNDVLNYKIN